MGKTFDKCKLCGQYRFLNFMGLCKRCGKDPKAHDIIEAAVEARKESLAAAAADAAKEAAQAEAVAAEAPEEETAANKTKSEELPAEAKKE